MYLLGTQIHPSFDLYSQTETIAAAAIVFVWRFLSFFLYVGLSLFLTYLSYSSLSYL